jgi:hypothetical protein
VTYFFGTKIAADCCLHSYDKMSNERALHPSWLTP